MEFYIFDIIILLFLWQLKGLYARHHHKDDNYPNPYDRDHDGGMDTNSNDVNELGDYCMYFRIDHDTRQTDTMFCPFGCCGSFDDQKCCEDPDKEEDGERGKSRIVHGLLIFAGVMLVVALSCCGFGIYKHKQAKLRKTSPGRNYQTTVSVERSAPYTIFYTPRSGSGWAPSSKDSKKLPTCNSQSHRTRPATVETTPPSYTADPGADLPPYSAQSPPPPYSFNARSTPPSSTEMRSTDYE